MGLRDLLREGAGELFGWDSEREELLTEAADGKMAQRRLDSLGWVDQGGGTLENYFEPDRMTREQQIERAYRYFFDDPIVKRSVKIRTNYVFRKGVSIPRYREDKNLGDDDDHGAAQDLIKRFWRDPENRKALTSKRAQREKNDELTVQGNIFLLMFRQEGEAPDTPIGTSAGDARPELDPPTMKLTDLRVREIVEIIMHPANQKIPVYYKRVYREKVARFERNARSGPLDQSYDESSTVMRVRYYRDWEFDAPTTWGVDNDGNPKPWGPPEELIDPVGRVYHVKINATSDMRFGLTDLQAALKWAQGLNQYMTSRMSVAQAIASIALQAKTKGGPTAVRQVVGQLQNASRTSPLDGGGAVQPGDGLTRVRGDQARTRAAVTNQGASLEPMVQDTGAAGAQIDTQIFKGQVAAATGVPVHQLGDSPQGGLSTLAALDGPLQAMIEDCQDDWKQVIHDVVGYMLAGEGFDPARVLVKMPPILMRDVGQTASMLVSVMAAVDPNGSSRELHRWVMAEILDAMGDPDAQEVIDNIFPAGYETPWEQTQKQMVFNASVAAAQAAQPPDGEPGGRDARQNSPAQIAASTLQNSTDAANVERNGGARGSPAPGASLARAQQRNAIARESDFIDATFEELDEDDLREAADEAMRGLAVLLDADAVV
jgi:hypothetical protein